MLLIIIFMQEGGGAWWFGLKHKHTPHINYKLIVIIFLLFTIKFQIRKPASTLAQFLYYIPFVPLSLSLQDGLTF
jgi:hypothetical protein